MQTRGMTLTHSEGETNPYKTILTPVEFCGILTEMRDNYDSRDKTQELIDKSVYRKQILLLNVNGAVNPNSFGQVFEEELSDIEIVNFNVNGDLEEKSEQLGNLCKNQTPDVIISNGLDEEAIKSLLIPLLRE